MRQFLIIGSLLCLIFSAKAQQPAPPSYNANTRFEQLGTELPTPNTYRTASGAPGKDYWQQKADYDIKAELDDENQKIIGTEIITYTNKSPDELRYLWLQLDQNLFMQNSINAMTQTEGLNNKGMTFSDIEAINAPKAGRVAVVGKDYGYKITVVKDKLTGVDLKYIINNTMMRIDLPTPLKPGITYSFRIDWNYLVTEYYGRSGMEYFPKDGNYNYFIAHWFPRMAVYDDVNGWQHKQFLGQGEFTLPFGDYKVELTVPNDHVVGATGECQNYAQVLSSTQMKRWEQAKNSKTPVVIVTQAEAEAAEKAKPTGKKTWIYKATNVRDFAFTSSRKFIWDAMQTDVYNNGKKIWSMSYYSKEGNPLWGQYSTRVVEHTLHSYGNHTIEYPYPVAISCHATTSGGMEYPMISFNGGRPEADGTYSEQVKAGMIGVIIHEVGHNFFPMIVNSDERQWTWMDEGLNSFCQYLAEQEWDRNFPSRRGEPQTIVPYMKLDKSQLSPIMTSSDDVISLGSNAYSKPATGLNILRETIMGRELFDMAFKEYARRWAFKHPKPADFFRTMEDASGVDLDWFWKGWFYGVEPVDQDLATVEWYGIESQDPAKQKTIMKIDDEAKRQTMSNIRNKTDIPQTVVEKDSTMRDFYNSYNKYAVNSADEDRYKQYVAGLSDEDKKLVESGMNFYVLNIKNKGGLPMPVIVKLDYEDGTNEIVRIPAEIWRFNDKEVKKTIASKKKVAKFTLDPFYEIADIDTENNSFPREPAQPTKFQAFKQRQFGAPQGLNPMQQAKKNQPAGTQSSGSKN